MPFGLPISAPDVVAALKAQTAAIQAQTAVWERVARTLESIYLSLHAPTIRSITLISEDDMDILTYSVTCDPATAQDVVSRELEVTVNGGAPSLLTIGGKENVFAGVEAPEDATVELALTDVDNKGNRSPTTRDSFVATDTIAPGAAGFTVALTGERTVEDPAPEPEPEPGE